MGAESVFFNGRVLTMDRQHSKASAFAVVLGGRFVGVGSDREVLNRWSSPDTMIVDLEGACVLPGFIESHNHFSAYAACLDQVDCRAPPNQTIEEIKVRIMERAASLTPGEWLRGYGFDDTLISDGRHLTRQDLDEVVPNNPVFISHISGHLAYVNTRAMELAGIGKGTPQPPGGEIRMDKDGWPTGLLLETALFLVARKIPSPEVSGHKALFQEAMTHYHRAGITSIHDGAVGYSPEGRVVIQAYRELEAEGKLTLRVYLNIMEHLYARMLGLGLGTGFGSNLLKIGCVKLLQDGSIQGLTAALEEPYHNRPRHRGELIMPQQQLDELVEMYHSQGMQIAIHCNGDRAIESGLRAFKRAQAMHPREDPRHMIIHCQLATRDQIRRMKAVGVIPSYFVNHVYYWGDRHVSLFLGPQRAARIDPLASTLEEGLPFTLHSDMPVTPVDPMFSIHCAVNRLTRQGELLGANERIGPLDAMRAYTTYAAMCSFEEDKKGSIEVGKLADFVVMSEDPLQADSERIKEIKVLKTVVGGKVVYDIQQPMA